MATEKTIWYQQNHISHGRATSTQEFKRGVGGRWASISRVEEWAEKRGLIDENGSLPLPDKQMIKLLEEVGDVYCMINLMTQNGVLDWKHIYARSSVKEEKLKIWSNLFEVCD